MFHTILISFDYKQASNLRSDSWWFVSDSKILQNSQGASDDSPTHAQNMYML